MTNAELREILEAIESLDTLDPEMVVTAARSKNHPLHPRFEWDDKVAGQQYRIQQARQLIGSVRVEVTVHKQTLTVPAYVANPAAESTGYVRTPSVGNDTQMAVRVVSQATATALGHLERVASLAAGLDLATAHQSALDSIKALASALEARK